MVVKDSNARLAWVLNEAGIWHVRAVVFEFELRSSGVHSTDSGFPGLVQACEESMSVQIAEISWRKTFVVNALQPMIFMPVHSLYINSE
ncbi:hypothetical protein G5S35_02705 [Paraburkholderia tropica]|uniref:hypothetical protein n=1 Tax=Paraburkholderia tropica TaxID=92647 RepID=UPI001604017D|nr:hypothetical protein [Paraburkholderia tropica]QNB10585.1 hypothetical protein G5S35_02705 [Paraburkholderia tropica]